jgi:spoIIIJ-associated protein
MEEQLQLIQDEAISLLEKLGVSASVEVEGGDEGAKVIVDTEENALLIGKHGNTLSSLEYILTLLVTAKVGEFKRVQIEVGGYREEREAYLRELADRLKEEVISSGYEKKIHGLKPWERRLIHLYLEEAGGVTTESMGEDRERVLVIKKAE